MIDDLGRLMHNAAQCNRVPHMAGKSRISVGLSSASLLELTALADQAHVSVSWMGERAIAEFLERHRNGEIQLPLVLNDNQKRGAA